MPKHIDREGNELQLADVRLERIIRRLDALTIFAAFVVFCIGTVGVAK